MRSLNWFASSSLHQLSQAILRDAYTQDDLPETQTDSILTPGAALSIPLRKPPSKFAPLAAWMADLRRPAEEQALERPAKHLALSNGPATPASDTHAATEDSPPRHPHGPEQQPDQRRFSAQPFQPVRPKHSPCTSKRHQPRTAVPGDGRRV